MKVKDIKLSRIIAAIAAVIMLFLVFYQIFPDIHLNIAEKPENKMLSENYKRASADAAEYIRDKYGFDAEVTEIQYEDALQYYDDPDTAAYISVNVLLKYGDRYFCASRGIRNNQVYWRDNYQADEIIKAAEKYIAELYPDGIIIGLKMGSISEDRMNYYDLFDDHYNGGNIGQIISSCNGSLDIIFADRTFSEKDIENFPDGFEVELISFDTEEHRNEFLLGQREYQRLNTDGTYSYRVIPNDPYQSYSAYINDYLGNIDGEMIGLDTRFS